MPEMARLSHIISPVAEINIRAAFNVVAARCQCLPDNQRPGEEEEQQQGSSFVCFPGSRLRFKTVSSSFHCCRKLNPPCFREEKTLFLP